MNLFTGCQVQFSRTDFGELSQECQVSRKQSEKYDGVEISLIKSILFSCWLFGSNWRGCRHTLALVFTVAPLSLVWLQLMCGRWVFPGAGGEGGSWARSEPRSSASARMCRHAGATLVYPRSCCSSKLSALRQTGVAPLCWKFSLCAGGWQWQRQKQLHFSLWIWFSRMSLWDRFFTILNSNLNENMSR